jgi:hypothetical protein
MGLCASYAESAIANSIDSESWPVMIPLSHLGAGYPTTRKTVFEVLHYCIYTPHI